MERKGEVSSKYFKRPLINLVWGGIGLSDIQNPRLKILYRIYSFLLIVIFAFFYVASEIIHIYKHLNDLEEVTLTMCYLIAHTIAVLKVILIQVKRKEVCNFIQSLEQGIFLPNEERGGLAENKMIKKAIGKTKAQAIVFASIVCAMLSTRTIPCLIQSNLEQKIGNKTVTSAVFPYPSTLPFRVNYEESPYYELVFFYQVICIALFGWYLGNTDTIITGLMIHVTSQFKILANAIETVTERAKRMTEVRQEEDDVRGDIGRLDCVGRGSDLRKTYGLLQVIEIYEVRFKKNLQFCINDCIRHHHAILSLTENMERTFNKLFLIQFLGTLFGICVGLYQSSLLPVTNPTFLSMASFTLAMSFQLLTYCWNGDELSRHSFKIAKNAYFCEWVPASTSTKLSLMLISLRAQKMCSLTAGKFTSVSLETFVTLLRGSFSYFMVLRRFHSEP